jgi:four helix bundle protein
LVKYEKLIAWQRSYALCLLLYKITVAFPSDERFGLTSQIRRSAYSVPLNLAEGSAKKSPRDGRHFFEIAHASLEEIHCQCRIARDLSYLTTAAFDTIDAEVHRASFLIHKLRQSIS